MAKIKVSELAKELDLQNKEVLNFLHEKGVEAKAHNSSIEEADADMVRKAFGKGGKTEKTEKAAALEKVEKAAPEKAEKPTAEKAPAQKTEEKAAPAKKENPEEKKDAKAAVKPAPAARPAEQPKKKNISFVFNPQNSQNSQGNKFVGGRPNGGNGQRPGNNQGRNAGGYGNHTRPAPHAPIKPLTPPSPTPSVQMVNSRPQPVKSQPEHSAAEQQPARQTVSAQPAQQAASRQNAENVQSGRPQGDRRPQGERPQNDRSDRPVRDNRGENRGDNRGQSQGFSRPQNGAGQGRPGMQGGRPQSGDRQGGFNRQGQGAAPGRGFGGGNAGRNDGRNDRRGAQGGRSQGGFAAEAPTKDMEKRRDDDKRRIGKEKDNKRSKKDYIYEEQENLKNKPGKFIKPEKKEVVEEQIKVITLPDNITIKDLADKMKMQPAAIIKKLFLEGKVVTVNQEISYEEAENIAMEYDILCEKEVKVDVIEELLKEEEEDEANLVERPPVICVMGHVDHGKTSLLDAIRKTNVTDKEAGGITQHIGAYTVTLGERKITFLDTPGHEAFTAMRMRGANSTDIAILVVAADDGVMPQTIEAISHAKAAGIEIIVAVNKIDKPSANIERVKQELTEYELIATDWGGNTEFVPVSAKSGEGISDLLETILLTADILELKANPNRRARGLVIEAELDKGRGPVATVLVQKGTLHVGDFISAGVGHGKVRAMVDDKGRRVKEAGPSTPVEILGLSDVPSAGEVFIAHENDKTAKSFAETYLAQNKEKKLEETKTAMSLDDLFSQIQEGNLKELNLIVKADVQGSVEAVKQSLLKLSNEEVVVKCIHGGVGAINESDVVLASASNAIIIGFNVRPDATAKATAEQEGVDIRLYKVIYQAIEDIEAAMKGMLDPVYEEKIIGHAEVRQIFKASQIGNIAGSYVLDGEFRRDCKIRITREGEQIYEGALASLKRFKDDVKEVKAGFECGLVFEGFDQMQELDIVEAYVMVEVPR
ncbi:MAG: translation initiation factor IF-2 [Lachnospiraceae bacterium]|nr:translation initiation factor IF-2 [Lachnospiraceae bacterium]